jgi:3-hydroxy acid dehydrogenase / malonic semialdehyde reductase
MPVVFISGATSGIGRAAAEIFASNGYDLILTGRRNERLGELSKELSKGNKIKILCLNFDIRKHDSVKKEVDSLTGEWKKIDILVNNAGLAAGLNPIHEGNIDDWEQMIDTNIKGLLYLTRYISPLMVKEGRGHIVNIGSIAGKETYANGNVYCATKHAVDSLNKAMRIDLLPFGIKVTAVNPGMVETEFSLVRHKGNEEKAKKTYVGLKPLEAADIAETIFWVATRPAHVNINDIIIMPAVQANSTTAIRKE